MEYVTSCLKDSKGQYREAFAVASGKTNCWCYWRRARVGAITYLTAGGLRSS
jgi:hypothetical protein